MEAVRETAEIPRDAANRLSVTGEVLAVLRLAFTFRLDARRLTGRDGTIAFLGVAALAVWALLDWLRHDDPVDLQPAAFTVIAACASLVLALAWLIRASSRDLPFRHALWLVAGYLPAAS